MGDIKYKSFCWVVGTTSFRTAKLNLKIEELLMLLDDFASKYEEWNWSNNDTQIDFYNYMQTKGFLVGKAARKDKDARQKTSGLVDIGFLDKNRIKTDSGLALLETVKLGKYDSDNIFNISQDSFVYLKQLLKTSLKINDDIVRPFLVTLGAIVDLGYLSYDEFRYLVPLIKDKSSYAKIIKQIKEKRNANMSIDEIIYEQIISMDNYQKAYEIFINHKVSKDLICKIAINRKSPKYDEIYYELYLLLKDVFLSKDDKLKALLEVIKRIKDKAQILWKNLIFGTINTQSIKKKQSECIHKGCPFLDCKNENNLKDMFFKFLHVFKAKATLEDYFDLNKRYFNLSDIIIFEHEKIKLDILPHYYFTDIIKQLKPEMFTACKNLTNNVSLEEISSAFCYSIENIYKKINKDYKTNIKNSIDVKNYIKQENIKRFDSLIDSKFSDATLIKLLDDFANRNDKEIEKLVTEDATISTIFEYIISIIWYKISDMQGDILDFMKLSLDANLLPKTHAGGGEADNVYKYTKTKDYKEHSLLIEMTLAEKTNQRKMEMEPVSRHLGNHLIKYGNLLDYSVFISTYLDANVISDFRFRSIMPYIKDEKIIKGMKIIPLDTKAIQQILEKKLRYSKLYELFDRHHKKDINSNKHPKDWYQEMIEEIKSL